MSTAMSFVLNFEIDELRRAELAQMVPQGELIDAFAPGIQRFEVLLSEEATRISATHGQMLGYDWTIIKQREPPTIWMSRTSKHFLELPQERIPGCAFSEILECTVEQTAQQDIYGDFTVQLVVVTLHDRFTDRRYTQRLWVSSDDRLRPFAEQLASILFGGLNCHQSSGYALKEIVNRGAPLRGEFYFGAETTPFSFFQLENLQIVDASPDAFTVPSDYTDLYTIIQAGKWPDESQPGLVPVKPLTIWSDGRWEFSRGSDIPPAGGADEPSGGVGQGRSGLTAEEFQQPTCLPSTRGSIIALELTQTLFNQLQELLNHISRRLTGFSGLQGTIVVDWLAQFKSDALMRMPPLGKGASVFCALRDEPVPSAPASAPEHVGGRGFLDIMVEQEARRRLRDNDLASLGLNSVMLSRITDPAFGGDFDKLTPDDQRDLREQVLAQVYAAPKLHYPRSTPWQKVFYDLVYIKVSNITFDVTIGNTPIFSPITIGPNGTVTLTIMLPEAGGNAEIARVASEVYLFYVFLTLVGCVAFPLLCFLSGPLIAVGAIILTDWAEASIGLSGITVTLTITPTVDPSDQVIRPVVSAVVAATRVFASYMSMIPTGLHQLVSTIYDIILALIGKGILPALAGGLSSGLTKALRNLTFPFGIEGMGFTPISSRVAGVAGDHIYLESEVNPQTGLVVNPFITLVDNTPQPTLVAEAAKFSSSGRGTHFLSFAVSQNFINQYVLGLWAHGEFNRMFSWISPEAAVLSQLLPLGWQIAPGSSIEFSWWPAAPPRAQIAPVAASQGKNYLMVFFDDIRLCITPLLPSSDHTHGPLRGPNVEFLFAARLAAQLGLGRVPDGQITSASRLQLFKGAYRAFDLYFDINTSHIELGPVEVFDLNSVLGPPSGSLSLIQNGKFDPLLRQAINLALADRPDSLIARGVADPLTRQVYVLNKQPPDTSLSRVNVELLPRNGIVYVHTGVNNLLLLLLERDSTGKLIVDPDTLDCNFGKGLWPAS